MRMALPTLSKLSPKYHPIHSSNLLPSIASQSPLSTHHLSSGERSRTVDDLITIFTKHPFPPESSELEGLAPFLTTRLVESALSRFTSWRKAHVFFTWASNQRGYRHNCYSYNAMASVLSGARQNAALSALAEDVVGSNCPMSPGGLGFFLRCLGNLGLVEEANKLFDQAKMKGLCVPNDYSYACLFEAMSKSGSVDLIESRFNEMMGSGLVLTKYTLTPLLRAYCNAGKLEKALGVYRDMCEKGWVDGHIFTILIVSFTKWGEVDKALELMKAMEDNHFGLNAKTFHVLINGFVKQSRVDEANRLLGKMRDLGFSVDVSLFDVLIRGFSKIKEFGKALSLYEEMKLLGIRPDVGILTELASCCSSEGDLIRLLEENQQAKDAEELVLLYNAVLNCLVNLGLIDKAYLVLQAMIGDESSSVAAFELVKLLKTRVFPSTSCFRTVIDGLLKTNKLDTALSLFKDMIRTGCKPDPYICNNLIDGLCGSNRLEESFGILRDMENIGLEPTEFTHNSLYWCQCRREDVAGALDLIKRMRSHGHKPWIKYSSLFVAQLCKNGKEIQAFGFLDDMLQEGFPPDIVSYSSVLNFLVKSREVDRALNVLRLISDRGCCPDVVAYNILINGLCKAQRISEAEDLVSEMVTKRIVPSVVTCNQLIDGWCKLGLMDRAMACLTTMFGEERDPNVVTYTTLIGGLCSVGKPNDAVMLFDGMESKGCVPNRITFMALISGLCKCGRPDSALSYLRKMEEKKMTPDRYVHLALLSSFLSGSDHEAEFKILKGIVDKGYFPDQLDMNHSAVSSAIHKLLADDRTSMSVKALIADGSLPTFDI